MDGVGSPSIPELLALSLVLEAGVRKILKRTLFIKCKKHLKCTKTFFIYNSNVFKCNRFIEL